MNRISRQLPKIIRYNVRCESSSVPSKTAPATKEVKEEKKYDPKDVTVEDLQWRKPWSYKDTDYYMFLRSFYSDTSHTSTLQFLQSPINLSPSAIKKWWKKQVEYKDIFMQSFIPERHQKLGNELAAAHFLVYRGASVKFHNEDKWIKANKYYEYDLPGTYESGKYLQAIECTGMKLYYEGLVNLYGLKKVEWLSLNNCVETDDWFLDRISNQFSDTLIYLDIRNCPKYTERGLGALYKLRNLRILRIDDMLMTSSFEMTCLLLKDHNKQLHIEIGDD